MADFVKVWVIYLEYFLKDGEQIVINPTPINLVVSFKIILWYIDTEHHIEDLKKKNASLLQLCGFDLEDRQRRFTHSLHIEHIVIVKDIIVDINQARSDVFVHIEEQGKVMGNDDLRLTQNMCFEEGFQDKTGLLLYCSLFILFVDQ